MPIWSVAPSSTSSAQWRPMARSVSVRTWGGTSWMGSSTSTIASIWSTWMRPSPWVRGMRGFTWAMTVRAVWTAARVTSTETPREQNPWRSGGDTCTSATSRGRIPVRKSDGTSERNTGR